MFRSCMNVVTAHEMNEWVALGWAAVRPKWCAENKLRNYVASTPIYSFPMLYAFCDAQDSHFKLPERRGRPSTFPLLFRPICDFRPYDAYGAQMAWMGKNLGLLHREFEISKTAQRIPPKILRQLFHPLSDLNLNFGRDSSIRS